MGLVRRRIRKGLFVFLFYAASSLHADVKKDSQVFESLLVEYQRFSKDYFKKTDGITEDSLQTLPRGEFNSLSEPVKAARFKQYNASYLNLLKLEKRVNQETESLNQKLAQTPLSNYQARGDLELKQAALKNRSQQLSLALFMISVNANMSVLEALKTLSPAEKTKKESEWVKASRPSLPGVWGGSFTERALQKNNEKLNLTPVDPEFYSTQLGQKLEKDLGGRAQFWSYDYTGDHLYVKFGDEVGKVSVMQQADGIRFVRTKVGPSFSEQRNADLRVDLLNAQGRFLTGNKEDPTLFGLNPAQQGEKLLDEKASHSTTKSKKDHDH